jgi:hypothetical protein
MTLAHAALDGHVHCGLSLPYESVSRLWQEADIGGGVVFSPVEEIYDRYDPSFIDSEEFSRGRAEVHSYLLELSSHENIFPYFFVWNDFSPVPEGFHGIKWHRHSNEPVYNYQSPECERLVEEICLKGLPIVLEEEPRNTESFIKRIAGRTVVIVPHMGALNGGYFRLKRSGVFENSAVWVDTALAGRGEIEDFAMSYGVERIIFGSDYPFGIPAHEKRKLLDIFSGDDLESVLSRNLLRLLRQDAQPGLRPRPNSGKPRPSL